MDFESILLKYGRRIEWIFKYSIILFLRNTKRLYLKEKDFNAGSKKKKN
jgi:hypothetical protein